MYPVFYCHEFNKRDLESNGRTLEKNFNELITDLEKNKNTSLGDVKLITGDGGIKYFRAKLSNSDRLLFTSVKHNDKDAFVILEVILNHDYHKSKFLTNKEKIKNIKIKDQSSKEVSDNAGTLEIKDTPQVRWLDKFITLSTTQEDIVENKDLPLIISGAAGSGKTSVALEKLRKIEEKFKEGRILYITQSENLIKKSKELYEYEYYDEIAGEFKIGVPGGIDFLSIHEFFEKRIKKDIEGKKPIDRSKFFLWFNEACNRDKFKEHKKDGDKIFEEFTAVIGGRGLGKEEYKELGNRQAIFPQGERDNIYGLFEKYKEFIEKDLEYYDPNLIAHECIEEEIYDAVVVDEVQDLTESTLSLTLKSLKNESKGSFLLCGDVNQVIHPSFFSISRLKSFFYKNTESKELPVCVLEKNYRNSKQVIELANRILHLKNYCFAPEDKVTANEKEAFFMKSDTGNTGNVSFIADDKKGEVAKKVSESINWAVLVLDSGSKEDARKLFSTPLVFNIHEAKGLEFKNVILHKFMFCKAYNGIWNIIKGKKKIEDAISEVRASYTKSDVNTSRNKNKEDKSFEEYKFYMNALYVGASRAIDSVYILDNEKKHALLQVIKPEVSIGKNIKKEESSPEAWKNKALELVDKGNIEQAESIEKKLRLEGEKEHAEEIMNALKAKGYHSEQAISELKTEPQKSSTMVPNEKRAQSPNKKKKLSKKELGENTNRLFLALQDGKLQLAEKLIKQGVNVNAQNEKDWIPLHFAARDGYGDIVTLLLQHEANVDAKAYDNTTSLHLAADNGHDAVVKLLLQHGAKVDAKVKEGATSLHLAARSGHDAVVKLLLQHGAKVDAETQKGSAPLHFAAGKGYTSVIELLLQHGAEVNAKACDNTTPLHLAAKRGLSTVVELLLNRGAEVNAKNETDVTPLHVTVQSGHRNTVELLLGRGANVNAKTHEGFTPLRSAAQQGHKDVVELFLAGPNINIGHVEVTDFTIKESKLKFLDKLQQDNALFNKVKEVAEGKNGGKLLREIEDLLNKKSKYGFKPSLNYSPDGNDENTTIKIAIKAGGKLLQLLYDYAEKNIDKDIEIFKQLKHAKEHENTQPKSDVSNVSVSGNLIQAQGFKLGGA